jgi:nucleotide-binding universal stress UspA family protein
MTIAVILAAITGAPSDGGVLDSAARLAVRSKAHLRVLHVRREAAEALYLATPEATVVTGELLAQAEHEIARAAEHAAAAYRACRERHALTESGAAPSIEWLERRGSVVRHVGDEGRLADLVVAAASAGARDGDSHAEITEAALFDTGRPLLLAPAAGPVDLTDRVLIAWKNGREAARAVAASLPLVALARKVAVFAAPEERRDASPAAGVVSYLARHGVAAEILPAESESNVGAALLAAAEREQATLLVMGGYGHSRLRELVLGGVTRHVLAHASVPVLMAH